MQRKHLFEFEDLPWFPRNIRACMQDHLRFMGDLSAPAYKSFAENLKSAMERSGQRRILDLCSGGGGPVRTILRLLRAQNFAATARVTDLFPHVGVRYATSLRSRLKGVGYFAAGVGLGILPLVFTSETKNCRPFVSSCPSIVSAFPSCSWLMSAVGP